MYFYVVLLTCMFFVNIKSILYKIATFKCYVMLHYISVDHKGGCDVYRERLGTIRVSVISIGRV